MLREFVMPDEPTDVKRVQSMDGGETVFRYDPDGARYFHDNWVDEDDIRYSWNELITDYEGVIEIPASDFDKAVEYFQGRKDKSLLGAPIDAFNHAQAIVNKVLEDANA